MSLRFWVRGQDQHLFELITAAGHPRIRFGFEFEESAEEAKTSVNAITIDDPDGDLELWGHRIFAVEETEAEDPDNRFIGIGYLGTMRVIRGPYQTGASRQYAVEVADINTIFNRRVMLGGGNKRPAETDVERIEWVESTAEGSLIDDTRYLLAEAPVNMSTTDYLMQGALSVYSDCAMQSNKNYYVTYFGDVGVDADNLWGFFSLWYGPSGSDEYASGVLLSNDYVNDVDMDTGYPMFMDDELSIDPMRIMSRAIVPYKGSYVTASKDSTRTSYALLDSVQSAPNVQSKSVAQARANRLVNDLDEPDIRASVKTIVPRAHVNRIRPGMLVSVRATHWPGFQGDPVLMRVMSRKVTEISEDPDATYQLGLVLSLPTTPPVATPSGAILHMTQGPDTDNLVHFGFPGDTPAPGYELQPTDPLLEVLEDSDPPNGGWPFYGWKVLGTGTIDIDFYSTVVGVLIDNISYTIRWDIRLNGVSIATASQNASGFLVFYGSDQLLTAEGVAVVPDDVITATLSCSPPTMPFFRTPGGTGQNGERLEITGGSLA